jgi:hypothetical protein
VAAALLLLLPGGASAVRLVIGSRMHARPECKWHLELNPLLSHSLMPGACRPSCCHPCPLWPMLQSLPLMDAPTPCTTP